MVVKVLGGPMDDAEKEQYVNFVKEKFPGRKINEITLKPDGDFIDISWVLEELPPFQRIRRITGYLVGTLDRWNDGKRAENDDRVKHGVDDK